MAKDDKKNAKSTKSEAKVEAKPEANKEAQKTDWKEQTKPDNNGTPNNGGCSTIAKVLIYFIPLALYVPWAYRMFKGNACCSEVPKCPTALSQGCPSSGSTSVSAPFSRLGRKFRAPQDQRGAEPSCSEYAGDMQQQQDRDSGKAKAVDVGKEREECLDHSKQCLEKCMEKCFDADRVEKKKKKKKKEKERKCDGEEDDDD